MRSSALPDLHSRERFALATLLSIGLHIGLIGSLVLAPGWPGRGASSGRAAPLIVRLIADQPQLSAEPEPAVAPSLLAPAQDPVAVGATGGTQESGLPGERYYRGSEVDERAIPLNQVDFQYPEQAFAARVSGSVVLELKIDSRGALRSVDVIRSDPPGIFEDAALHAVRALSFKPALLRGTPVGSIKRIEVPFDPNCYRTGSCSDGAQSAAR
jgi:TonB family protein